MKANLILTPSNILTITIFGLEWDSSMDTSLIGRTLELAYGYHLHGQTEYDDKTGKYMVKFHRWASDMKTLEAAKKALTDLGVEIEENSGY